MKKVMERHGTTARSPYVVDYGARTSSSSCTICIGLHSKSYEYAGTYLFLGDSEVKVPIIT